MIKTTTGQLGLTIPVQSHTTATSTIRLTPKDIERWRNDLPLADTGISSKKLYNLLLEINQTNIPPKERFTMLELLQAATNSICQNLKKHYLHQTAPLSPQKIAIARLAETLETQITYGYKLVIEQLHPHKDSNGSEQAISTSIERTLSAFNKILLRAYQLYSPPPSGTWSEIYRLYLYAGQAGFLKESAISTQFGHLFLFATTDPYKWRQNDLDNLNNVVNSWLPKIQISKVSHFKITSTPNSIPSGLALIDPRQDMPPALLGRKVKDLNHLDSECFIVDLHKLMTHLDSLVIGMEARESSGRMTINPANADTDAALPLNIIKGLLHDWHASGMREKPRTNKNEQVRVCVGLSATHYYVSNGRPFSTGMNESGGVADQSSLTGGLSMNMQESKSSDEESIDLSMIPLPDEKRFVKLNEFKTTTCTIVDDAEGGRCILWGDDAYPAVEPGDIVGVQSTQATTAPWQVGVIRWLKHAEGDKLKMGVQLFTDPVIAAGIQALKDGQPSGQYLRCLLVKNIIITSPIPFRSGTRVTIRRVEEDSTSTFEADLVKLLESSGSHKQFQFMDKESRIKTTTMPATGLSGDNALPNPMPTKEEEKKPENKNGDDPFDSLWNQL
ncbi:MAG: hypothetical protein RLZ35_969 [Pseudomonadota bacterium]|jgi:hypothetical protein